MAHDSASAQVQASSPYVWDNRWEQAQQRLTLLNELLDARTRRHMAALGLRPGWSCLDVATGAGSVARWLSEQVGPAGRVVATDLDTHLLHGQQADNLVLLQHNIITDPPPGRDFDLVHTRGLLMHLPQREQILRSLVDMTRRGGWTLIEEFDLYAIQAIGAPSYAQAWRHISQGLSQAGFHDSWARDLPALLCQAGLSDVRCSAETFFFPGGSAAARWVRLTWDQAMERMALPPSEREAVLRARQELADAERWFVLPTIVSAWGQRPAALP